MFYNYGLQLFLMFTNAVNTSKIVLKVQNVVV